MNAKVSKTAEDQRRRKNGGPVRKCRRKGAKCRATKGKKHAATWRDKNPERYRELNREHVRKHRERPAVIPDDAQYYSRRACPECGTFDPLVHRTLEKSDEVLVQRLRCRNCKHLFTGVSE